MKNKKWKIELTKQNKVVEVEIETCISLTSLAQLEFISVTMLLPCVVTVIIRNNIPLMTHTVTVHWNWDDWSLLLSARLDYYYNSNFYGLGMTQSEFVNLAYNVPAMITRTVDWYFLHDQLFKFTVVLYYNTA